MIELAVNEHNHWGNGVGILLIKAVQRWRKEHDSTLPANAKEKAAFRAMLKSWQRSVDGIPVEVLCLSQGNYYCSIPL